MIDTESFDSMLGHFFPTQQTLVRISLSWCDSKTSVEQKHALFEPMRQITMLARRDAEIRLKFCEDVVQTLGQWSNVFVDTEAQTDRMSRCRVRILAQNDDLCLVHRA